MECVLSHGWRKASREKQGAATVYVRQAVHMIGLIIDRSKTVVSKSSTTVLQ